MREKPPEPGASLLFALRPDDDGGYLCHVDRRVEKLRAGQLREMNQLVPDLLDFPGNLLTRFHPQLDRLAGIFLKNAQNGIPSLQIDFALREQIGAGEGQNEGEEK